MYLKYWNFTRKPFTQLYDESLTVFRDSLAQAYHTVTLAIQLPPAVVWITGPEGSGKSALLQLVQENYADECQVVPIKEGNLSEEKTVISYLKKDLQSPAHHLPGGDKQLLSILKSRLETGNVRTIVITLDDLTPESPDSVIRELEAIERVSRTSRLPVTCVLTTEDRQALPDNKFGVEQQLASLDKASKEESEEIIRQRIEESGGSHEIFEPDALTQLWEFSKGNIRRLLIFADLCLQVGAIKKVRTIDEAFVEKHISPYLDRVKDKQVTAVPRDHTQVTGVTGQGAPRPGVEAPEGSGPVARPENNTSSESKLVPSSIPSHRLISQIELETYKSTSNRERDRKFVEDLQKKISTGQINLVEAVKKFDQKSLQETVSGDTKTGDDKKAEGSKSGKQDKTGKESGQASEEDLASLDAQLLYHRGLDTMSDVLETLRDKRFTDLTNVFSLATAIVRSIKEDKSLLKLTLKHSKNYDLHHHLLNVGILVSACARELGFSEDQREEITVAGLMHDIGHLHTNEELIQSPARFDRQDFRIIKRHPVVGRDMIIHLTNGSKKLAEIISQEHERDDGLGYPNYLVGEQIHVPAKIIGVCDTFEALSHPRSYRKALSPEEALVQINSAMTRRTDPQIVQALYRSIVSIIE